MEETPKIANQQRGEIKISLGTTDFILNPSMENIEAVESNFGKSFMKMMGEVRSGTLDLTSIQAATFVFITQKDEPKWSFQKIRALVHKHGVLNILPAITVFLNTALSGSDVPEKDEAGGNGQAKVNP